MSEYMMPEQAQHAPAHPPKPRRNRTSAKQAGTRFATGTAAFLALYLDDDRIERRTQSGAYDRGDITGVRTVMGARLVLECKDRARMNLSGWVDEAAVEAANDDAPYGVVVHKRTGRGKAADQYVTMTLETLAWLLEGGPDNLRGV